MSDRNISDYQTHGILMTFGFGFLIPIAIIIKRYFQFGHSAYFHRSMAIFALGSITTGALYAFKMTSGKTVVAHGILGWSAFALFVVQFIIGIRQTPVEQIQQHVSPHKILGKVVLLVGVSNVIVGLWLFQKQFSSQAAYAFLLGYFAWLLFLIGICIVLEFRQVAKLSNIEDQDSNFRDKADTKIVTVPTNVLTNKDNEMADSVLLVRKVASLETATAGGEIKIEKPMQDPTSEDQPAKKILKILPPANDTSKKGTQSETRGTENSEQLSILKIARQVAAKAESDDNIGTLFRSSSLQDLDHKKSWPLSHDTNSKIKQDDILAIQRKNSRNSSILGEKPGSSCESIAVIRFVGGNSEKVYFPNALHRSASETLAIQRKNSRNASVLGGKTGSSRSSTVVVRTAEGVVEKVLDFQ